MSRYEDYNPKQHVGLPLFAIEDGLPDANGAIPTFLRRVTDPAELASAKAVPFYYVVQVDGQPESV